ncbi:hypothetical protein FOA52_015720 [Chlamydomonas sp. UWO 241]|nr:hypothetical protein FOA52_015720 [Chlamydomonas sp. UWO 241]
MGILGVPMTLNLIKAGYEVVVHNRSADKCAPAEAAGAKVVGTPREVAQACDYVFAVVSDPAAALAIATGPDGIAAGMSAGKGYVDVSTVDAATAQTVAAAVRGAGGMFLEAPVSGSKAVAAAVRGAGGMFLEAPVSGSKGPAEAGALIFLTAGDEELFTAVAGPLDVMGKAKFFLGDVGAGANMKLVVNMVMGSMMVAFAEGLSLAESAGLNQKDVVDVIALGAIAAPMFAMKGPLMMHGNYAPAFPLKHQQKDMRLALELGESLSQPLPVAAASNGAYMSALDSGLGGDDFCAVVEAIVARRFKT